MERLEMLQPGIYKKVVSSAEKKARENKLKALSEKIQDIKTQPKKKFQDKVCKAKIRKSLLLRALQSSEQKLIISSTPHHKTRLQFFGNSSSDFSPIAPQNVTVRKKKMQPVFSDSENDSDNEEQESAQAAVKINSRQSKRPIKKNSSSFSSASVDTRDIPKSDKNKNVSSDSSSEVISIPKGIESNEGECSSASKDSDHNLVGAPEHVPTEKELFAQNLSLIPSVITVGTDNSSQNVSYPPLRCSPRNLSPNKNKTSSSSPYIDSKVSSSSSSKDSSHINSNRVISKLKRSTKSRKNSRKQHEKVTKLSPGPEKSRKSVSFAEYVHEISMDNVCSKSKLNDEKVPQQLEEEHKSSLVKEKEINSTVPPQQMEEDSEINPNNEKERNSSLLQHLKEDSEINPVKEKEIKSTVPPQQVEEDSEINPNNEKERNSSLLRQLKEDSEINPVKEKEINSTVPPQPMEEDSEINPVKEKERNCTVPQQLEEDSEINSANEKERNSTVPQQLEKESEINRANKKERNSTVPQQLKEDSVIHRVNDKERNSTVPQPVEEGSEINSVNEKERNSTVPHQLEKESEINRVNKKEVNSTVPQQLKEDSVIHRVNEKERNSTVFQRLEEEHEIDQVNEKERSTFSNQFADVVHQVIDVGDIPISDLAEGAPQPNPTSKFRNVTTASVSTSITYPELNLHRPEFPIRERSRSLKKRRSSLSECLAKMHETTTKKVPNTRRSIPGCIPRPHLRVANNYHAALDLYKKYATARGDNSDVELDSEDGNWTYRAPACGHIYESLVGDSDGSPITSDFNFSSAGPDISYEVVGKPKPWRFSNVPEGNQELGTNMWLLGTDDELLQYDEAENDSDSDDSSIDLLHSPLRNVKAFTSLKRKIHSRNADNADNAENRGRSMYTRAPKSAKPLFTTSEENDSSFNLPGCSTGSDSVFPSANKNPEQPKSVRSRSSENVSSKMSPLKATKEQSQIDNTKPETVELIQNRTLRSAGNISVSNSKKNSTRPRSITKEKSINEPIVSTTNINSNEPEGKSMQDQTSTHKSSPSRSLAVKMSGNSPVKKNLIRNGSPKKRIRGLVKSISSTTKSPVDNSISSDMLKTKITNKNAEDAVVSMEPPSPRDSISVGPGENESPKKRGDSLRVRERLFPNGRISPPSQFKDSSSDSALVDLIQSISSEDRELLGVRALNVPIETSKANQSVLNKSHDSKKNSSVANNVRQPELYIRIDANEISSKQSAKLTETGKKGKGATSKENGDETKTGNSVLKGKRKAPSSTKIVTTIPKLAQEVTLSESNYVSVGNSRPQRVRRPVIHHTDIIVPDELKFEPFKRRKKTEVDQSGFEKSEAKEEPRNIKNKKVSQAMLKEPSGKNAPKGKRKTQRLTTIKETSQNPTTKNETPSGQEIHVDHKETVETMQHLDDASAEEKPPLFKAPTINAPKGKRKPQRSTTSKKISQNTKSKNETLSSQDNPTDRTQEKMEATHQGDINLSTEQIPSEFEVLPDVLKEKRKKTQRLTGNKKTSQNVTSKDETPRDTPSGQDFPADDKNNPDSPPPLSSLLLEISQRSDRLLVRNKDEEERSQRRQSAQNNREREHRYQNPQPLQNTGGPHLSVRSDFFNMVASIERRHGRVPSATVEFSNANWPDMVLNPENYPLEVFDDNFDGDPLHLDTESRTCPPTNTDDQNKNNRQTRKRETGNGQTSTMQSVVEPTCEPSLEAGTSNGDRSDGASGLPAEEDPTPSNQLIMDISQKGSPSLRKTDTSALTQPTHTSNELFVPPVLKKNYTRSLRSNTNLTADSGFDTLNDTSKRNSQVNRTVRVSKSVTRTSSRPSRTSARKKTFPSDQAVKNIQSGTIKKNKKQENPAKAVVDRIIKVLDKGNLSTKEVTLPQQEGSFMPDNVEGGDKERQFGAAMPSASQFSRSSELLVTEAVTDGQGMCSCGYIQIDVKSRKRTSLNAATYFCFAVISGSATVRCQNRSLVLEQGGCFQILKDEHYSIYNNDQQKPLILFYVRVK